MNTLRLLALASLLFTVACRATSSQNVPLPDQGVTISRPDVTRIYFVRDDNISVQNRAIKVLESDKEVGLLTSSTYLCWERPAGRTLARAFYEAVDPGRGRVEGLADLDCEAGRVYYFNVMVDREEGRPSVTAIDAEEGQKLVAARKPAGAH